jgi:hypothetical protein
MCLTSYLTGLATTSRVLSKVGDMFIGEPVKAKNMLEHEKRLLDIELSQSWAIFACHPRKSVFWCR